MERQIIHQEKMPGKKLRKITQELLLIEKICPAFVWKHNSKEEKEIILLMISNKDGSVNLLWKSYLHY